MLRITLAGLLVLLLFVPVATAHTTVTTTDGKYTVTVGNLDEPVSTHTKTGLDLIIRANNTARSGITGLHLTLNATLIAPNGEEMSQPLEAQFGRPGAYSFEEPYYLTVAGEYYLRLEGKINGTIVNFARILVGSGPIPAIEELGFPDDVQSNRQLQERIAMLEAEVAALKANGADGPRASSPSVGSIVTLATLGGLAFVLVRTRR